MATEMTTKCLSPLEVRIGIKRGYSSADFQEKFGCTPDELESFITDSFGTNANRTIHSLHANNKRTRRQPTSISSQLIPPPQQPSDHVSSAPVPSVVDYDASITHGKIAALRADLASYATDTADLITRYEDQLGQLKSVNDELIAIKNRLHQLTHDQTSLLYSIGDLADRIEIYIQLYSEKSAQLETFQRQIQSPQSYAICVFQNGTFEPFDDGISLKLNDSGHQRVYKELLRNPACRTLCLDDIQMLARTLCIVRNSPQPLVPLLENTTMEPIYAALQMQS